MAENVVGRITPLSNPPRGLDSIWVGEQIGIHSKKREDITVFKVSPGGPDNEDLERMVRAIRTQKEENETITQEQRDKYELLLRIITYPGKFPIKVSETGRLYFNLEEDPVESKPQPITPLSYESYTPEEDDGEVG